MLNSVNPNRLLYIDIETAACARSYEELDPVLRKQWELKYHWKKKEADETGRKFDFAQHFMTESGLSAEFGKIIVVVVGKLTKDGDKQRLELKTYANKDEKDLLVEVAECCSNLPQDIQLATFNGKNFDNPYLARRMLINGVKIPSIIDVSGKKPWEIKMVDVMEIFAFGEWKHYVRMELVCHLLGIPSPKDGIVGAEVSAAYYDGKLDEIATYCRKDVAALTNIVLKMMELPILEPGDVVEKA